MAEGLYQFRADMDVIVKQVGSTPVSSKARRFIRMYEAGLPLDITVRWFPVSALEAMEARVEELTRQGKQVWISQGLPWDPGIDTRVTSVERKTDLIKNIESVDDFRQNAMPRLKQWEEGSWAKMFYDTPVRSLTGGILRIDTNRYDNISALDMRTLRLEAASGMSDVRDLDRQMSAQQVLVLHSTAQIFSDIASALESMDCSVRGLSDFSAAFNVIGAMGPSEPRAVLLDCTGSSSDALNILRILKKSRDTARIPVVLIVSDEAQCPSDLRPMVAAFIQHPISAEEVRCSVFRMRFQLNGNAAGFTLPYQERSIQHEVDRLLNTVLGVGGVYLRMMAQIANIEMRPTIAFEFKLVPVAPYDFFFMDYEWSGIKNEFHRFDWLYTLGAS